MNIIKCPNCERELEHHAFGLCINCYRKLKWKPKLRKCVSCNHLKAIHAKEHCAYCYNKNFHAEYYRLASRRLNTGVTKELFGQLPKKCQICGFYKIIDVHHLVPRSKGGSNERSNLVVLCPNHHKMCHHADYKEELAKELKKLGY